MVFFIQPADTESQLKWEEYLLLADISVGSPDRPDADKVF
jgi:hypothetical protein